MGFSDRHRSLDGAGVLQGEVGDYRRPLREIAIGIGRTERACRSAIEHRGVGPQVPEKNIYRASWRLTAAKSKRRLAD